MSFKNTWLWLLVASGLFAFIFFFQRNFHHASGALKILPNLAPADVTSIQVRPGPGQLEIRACRTNAAWQLTEPLVYPAQAASIDDLLKGLLNLTAAASISESELRAHTNADEEFGFASPQASILIQQGDYLIHVLLGDKTPPGDQLFLEVVGHEGAFVVDASLLKLIPRSANDWRDTTLLNLDAPFDRIAVTNNSKAFVLRRDPNLLWRVVDPFPARADNARIEDSLRRLHALRVRQFVSDDPKADLDSFGLANPDTQLALAHGTNPPVLLQFGKIATNDPSQIYARRADQNTIVTVTTNALAPWRGISANDFRDPHLLTLTEPVQMLEVHAQDHPFSLVANPTNDSWRVLPENFPADATAVQDCLSLMGNLKIIDFAKDVVNAPDWPKYGLDPPARRYILKAVPGPSSTTNTLLADLYFGFATNQPNRVYARRADETSVYAVSPDDFAKLPYAPYQLRERKLWSFSTNDIAGITIHQAGKIRSILRAEAYKWSLAPGSQGVVDDIPLEETVRGLCQATAADWAGFGPTNFSRFGFTNPPYEVTFDLKNGQKASIQFGGDAPSGNRYAAVSFDGQPWFLELPWLLYRDIAAYLAAP